MSKAEYSSLQMTSMDKNDADHQSTNEDIYCKALAETLHHTALPVTVGFYGPYGQNKRRLLSKVKNALKEKDGKGAEGNRMCLLSFIWRVIFYCPVFCPLSSKRAEYIFINFNAWDHIGCDYTWAGIVTKLVDEIENKYKIIFSFVRAFGGKESQSGDKWVSKNCIQIFCYCFACIFISLILGIVLLNEFADNDTWKKMGYITIVVPGAASCTPFIPVAKNFFFTIKKKLQSNMDRKDLSAQLAFMHSVKKEVKAIIYFLRLMELKEERKIRVVIHIVNLDLCPPDKVVAVLDAINILLCDPNAPFISILAADPSILVECIQRSSNTCSNGYLYLDRIVSLPFSLPQMSGRAKSQLLKEILMGESTLFKATHTESDKDDTGEVLRKEEDVNKKISVHLCKEDFDNFFPGSSVQMKRVVNTVLTVWTMIQMGFQPKGGHKGNGKHEGERIEEVINWVILANFWPCRLSWILLCMEDMQQQKSLEGGAKTQGGEISWMDSSLWKFYYDNIMKLDKIKYSVRKLLELDGDPNLFQKFLEKNKHFTVEKVKYFSDLLVNLDFSLKRHFELCGFHGIIGEKKKHNRSPTATSIDMCG